MISQQKQQSNQNNLEELFLSFARFFTLQLYIGTKGEEIFRPLWSGEPLSATQEEGLALAKHLPHIPQYTYLYYHFTENGYQPTMKTAYYFEILRQNEYTSFFLSADKESSCARAHWESGVIPYPPNLSLSENASNSLDPPSFEDVREVVTRELALPVLDLCQRTQQLQPTDEQIIHAYRHFRERWTASTLQWDVVVPLINFTSDVSQECTLGTHLHLAPFPENEKQVTWNQELLLAAPVSDYPMDVSLFASTRFKLIGSRYQKKDSRLGVLDPQDIVKKMGDIFTAFRLLKHGSVGVAALFETSHFSSWWQVSAWKAPLSEYRSRESSSIYELNEAEIPKVDRLLDALQQIKVQQQGKSAQHLAIALRRFNQAYGRDLLEDKIIDLTIALESTLLAKERDELNYRLSLRGSALLANAEPQWEPNKSQTLLKAMYDIRSGIVHNGQQLADLEKDIRKLQRVGIQPQEFPQQCENIVRDILRTYTLRGVKGQSVEMVNQELDKRIVEGVILERPITRAEQGYEQS